jgi:EAL domain-containing protein (putative c-di-GMP-specific phosphodiesterase class I)
MIVRALTSRSLLLPAVAVGMLVGISLIRFEVGEPGVMLFAVVPIGLLGMLYGVRGGLAGAAVASAVFLVWAFTRGHPSAVALIEEPAVFFLFGLLTGVYAEGALGDPDPRRALQRADLRRGLRRGEVVFHYQPLADARSLRAVGFEALARWQHPVRGLLQPAEFIPVAELDERTIWELTLVAVDRALADLSAWGEIAAEIRMWINLSPASVGRRDLAAEFSHLLEKHGLPASRLAIEVTETALIRVPHRAAPALDSLRQLGMTIVLDDFGAGQSSIGRLGRLPIDALKVDLDLIGVPAASDPHRILRAIIELAQALGLQVVAERVEDADGWTAVARAGCDLVQGFGVSPPLPADQVQAWLRHPSFQSAMSQGPAG